MIKSVKKIKNLGLFPNYQWETALPDFERYNLIYGWNGSGKTTFSKLFSALEKGEHPEFPGLEYEVSSDTGTFKNNQAYTRKVRVFNRDYIDNNIELVSCKANPIFVLGEENKAIAQQIIADEKLLGELQNTRKLKEDSKGKKENERGKKFTDIARIIGANTSGTSIRSYRKNNAEDAFKSLQQKQLLSEVEQKGHVEFLKQEERPRLGEFGIPKSKDDDLTKDLIAAQNKALSLLSETVESIVIERLKANNDISEWVENGLSIHGKHKSANCEFCDQTLPEARVKKLSAYFNEEDRNLKTKLDNLAKELRDIYSAFQAINAPDKANLYKELQEAYQSKVDSFEKEKKALLSGIEVVGKAVINKKTKTTEKASLDKTVNTEMLATCTQDINALINQHNDKTQNFEQGKKKAQELLEKHYLSEIFDEVKALDKEIKTLTDELKKLIDGDPSDPKKHGISPLANQIRENKAKISSSARACEAINKKLNTFLGRSEISFEVVEEGFLIKRNGIIAKNLSEGEKTAIAFVYFVIHLQDENFNIDDGIVVIDDPISSLDSNSLFQAFAFLKNAVKKAKQVFLLTHNYDFLRLLLNWLKNVPNSAGKKTFYMLKNKYSVGSEREAYIAELDPELKRHESEYHYLVKLLLEFESDGTIASVYHIPTIARKVLETFLMFRVPNNDKLYTKLESLDFDEDKKTSLYKFTNDQTHITGRGFDPSLIPETQKNVKYLLEMMKATFPEHYDILVASLQNHP